MTCMSKGISVELATPNMTSKTHVEREREHAMNIDITTDDHHDTASTKQRWMLHCHRKVDAIVDELLTPSPSLSSGLSWAPYLLKTYND